MHNTIKAGPGKAVIIVGCIVIPVLFTLSFSCRAVAQVYSPVIVNSNVLDTLGPAPTIPSVLAEPPIILRPPPSPALHQNRTAVLTPPSQLFAPPHSQYFGPKIARRGNKLADEARNEAEHESATLIHHKKHQAIATGNSSPTIVPPNPNVSNQGVSAIGNALGSDGHPVATINTPRLPAPTNPPPVPALKPTPGLSPVPANDALPNSSSAPPTVPVVAKIPPSPVPSPTPVQVASASLPPIDVPSVGTNPTSSVSPPATPAAPGNDGTSVLFSGGSAELNDSAKQTLEKLAATLKQQSSAELQLYAYAQGTAETASQARRLALSRALSVRTFLVDQGVSAARIVPRPIGTDPSDQPADRVDLKLTSN